MQIMQIIQIICPRRALIPNKIIPINVDSVYNQVHVFKPYRNPALFLYQQATPFGK